ncbi:unnamed protein product [Phytomonas sp. Hart1]|nr:unnamed protein product [Phytomonas sp. Hart1]|eukprot:CCW69862.1 unnamed protein product [Phytomonas sp. isolate Hart1]
MITECGKNAHEPLFVLRQHDSPVLSCSFYPSPHNNDESKLFISGDTSGTVILWDLSLRRPLLSFHSTKCAIEQNSTKELFTLSIEGVLAVGFFCPRNISNMKPMQNNNAYSGSLTYPGEQSALSTEGSSSFSNSTVSVSRRPPRRRFRLFHDSIYQNTNNMKHLKTVYIYSQCRNQHLYIWECKLNDEKVSLPLNNTTPRLLHIVQVPQHGFCTVASYYESNGSTLLAVPHDAQGIISLWRVSVVSTMNGNESTKCRTPQETLVEDCSSTNDCTSVASPDTAAIGPHATLDACEIAKQGSQHCTLPQTRLSLDTVHSTGFTDAAINSPLHLHFLGSFCTCKGFKGGTIMHIYIKDEHDLIVSFESGHVVLCQYHALFYGAQQGNRGMIPCKEVRVPLKILGIVRAFPEPSISCLYHAHRVLVTSAEGRVHSYRLIYQNRKIVEEGDIQDNCHCNVAARLKSPEQSESVHFFTVWRRKFNKGLGSAVLQDDFAVLGCWDHSLRVLDGRTGNVLSALPFHTEAVNSVCIAPSTVAMEASFGFDSRQPWCYEYQPRINNKNSDDLHEKNAGVYVFASASNDGCIALWRVDFFAILKNQKEIKRVSSKLSGQKKDISDTGESG